MSDRKSIKPAAAVLLPCVGSSIEQRTMNLKTRWIIIVDFTEKAKDLEGDL